MHNSSTAQIILAFVGMPGSGKSEATAYLQTKGIHTIRFGDITEEKIKELGLSLTPEHEQIVRERLRDELGMAAYAICSLDKIEAAIKKQSLVVIDGLYSWEEYKFLKSKFQGLIVVHIYTERKKRYERLAVRPVRPFSEVEAEQRDIAEIEQLQKGGPIAIADYIVDNDNTLSMLHQKIETLYTSIRI